MIIYSSFFPTIKDFLTTSTLKKCKLNRIFFIKNEGSIEIIKQAFLTFLLNRTFVRKMKNVFFKLR